MNDSERFQLCLEQARKIVACYRAEAPEGFDPQGSYAAIIGGVASLGSAAIGAASSGGGGGAGGPSVPKFTPLKLPPVPKPILNDKFALEKTGVQFDQYGYTLSDRDFAKRHAPLVQAEKLFENQTLKDQQGDSELMPAVQNEFIRAGLQGALSSFGNTPGTLAPGSSGEADVARNLGVSIAGFQDRNRQNRQNSLVTAEQLFPRRSFGISGNDAIGLDIGNTTSENNYMQAQHAQDVALAQYNANGAAGNANAQVAQGNVNAQAGAVGQQSLGSSIGSAGSILGKLVGSFNSRQPTAASAPNYAGWKPGPQAGTFYAPQG